jgi:hypothetical protein
MLIRDISSASGAVLVQNPHHTIETMDSLAHFATKFLKTHILEAYSAEF